MGVMLDKNNMGPGNSLSFSPDFGRVPFLLFGLGGTTPSSSPRYSHAYPDLQILKPFVGRTALLWGLRSWVVI